MNTTLKNPSKTLEHKEIKTPEGKVGLILELEAKAEIEKEKARQFIDLAKKYEEQAKALREELKNILESTGIVCVKHESGFIATLAAKAPKVQIDDEAAVMVSLKKGNLNLLIKQVPAHEEVDEAMLQRWLKSNAYKGMDMLSGVSLWTTKYIVITKPKK